MKGREKQEPKTRALRTFCLLSSSLTLHFFFVVCFLFLFSLTQPRTTCRGDTTYTEMGLSHQLVINQESALQTCPQANLMEAFFFQLEGPSFQIALACVKLTDKTTQTALTSTPKICGRSQDREMQLPALISLWSWAALGKDC